MGLHKTRIRKILQSKFFLAAVVVGVILGSISVVNNINTPTNLGKDMKYVSKDTSGCAKYLPFFCWSPRITTYYFATGLTVQEVCNYFPSNECAKNESIDYPQISSNLSYKELTIEADSGGGAGFTLNYYENKDGISDLYNLKTDLPHIVSFDEYSFNQVKKLFN